MGALKSFAYPILQRARYAKLISAYEKAKSLPMQENKIFMLSTSKGRLGGNLAAIKNYIEKNSLRLRLLPTSARFRQNNSARALRKAGSFWSTITSRAFIRSNFAIINNLYRFGTQWAHSSDSATAEKRLKKIRSRIKIIRER